MDGLDVRAFEELMEESQDLQSDAMRGIKEPLDAIVDAGRDRRATREYAEFRREQAAKTVERRKLLLGIGAVGTLGAIGLGGAFASSAAAAEAGADADVMALQTAASLENLAVFTYDTALKLDYLQGDSVTLKTVQAFATMTMKQHDEHAKAFNARAVDLGGKQQKDTHPMYTKAVMDMLPDIKAGGPLDVVALAITLENVATSTYVENIQGVEDPQVRLLFGTVAGVESQHLATLYAVEALLKNDAPELVTVEATGGAVDAAKLPAKTAEIAIPETFKETELAVEPSSGAVK